MRDDVERETDVAIGFVLDLVDGQRHAIDRDRAFLRHIGRDVLARDDLEPRRAADILGQCDPADRVDMTGNEVPAKLVAQTQRAFEIEAAVLAPLVLRGAADGLARNVDREPGIAFLAALLDHRQAYARAGDRGTDVDPGGVPGACDHGAQVAPVFDALNGADGSDDPGEHARS